MSKLICLSIALSFAALVFCVQVEPRSEPPLVMAQTIQQGGQRITEITEDSVVIVDSDSFGNVDSAAYRRVPKGENDSILDALPSRIAQLRKDAIEAYQAIVALKEAQDE